MLKDTMFRGKSGIYKIENTLTGEVYIGVSVDMKRRKREHINTCFNSNSIAFNLSLYSSIRDLGIENFDFDVLEYVQDVNKLNELEDGYIEKYNSVINGYNSKNAKSYTYNNKYLKDSVKVEVKNKYTGELVVFEKLKKGRTSRYNKGVNDVKGVNGFNVNPMVRKAYDFWSSRLKWCYNERNRHFKSYGAKGVKLCDEWLVFSSCLTWFIENYREGCELDKDSLSESYNNRIYSPSTCQFISKEENLKLRTHYRRPKEYYKSNAITRRDFKVKCAKEIWDFEDFIEVESLKRNSSGNMTYFYMYNPTKARKLNKNRHIMRQKKREIIHYEGIENRYVENSCTKQKFKEYCKRNNLRFEDFIEVKSGDKWGHAVLYFYVYNPTQAKITRGLHLETVKNKYVKIPCTRASFKSYCKTHSLNFDLFDEIDSGEKQGKIKLYFYTPNKNKA